MDNRATPKSLMLKKYAPGRLRRKRVQAFTQMSGYST
jgi:hypothetical protein